MNCIWLLFVVNSLMGDFVFHKTWMNRSETMSEFIFSSKTYSPADEFFSFFNSLFKTVLCSDICRNG